MTKKSRLNAAALAISAGLLLATTGTAQAGVLARLDLSQGRGYGGHNGTNNVYACDTKADGWGVRTYYELTDGFVDLVGDANGSSSGCGNEPTRAPVKWFAVCAGPNGQDSECVYS
ncbi:hypothetical protein Q5425_33345 [Amycolatopsis sp. A133]|uniref:hypothetical protein n=1 Tax=Amycolatopsis sp. A133 TaxID=3064472 RepID=UPI0027EA02E1|nr:hypothetical protein [Amycolatopsis sp. A133]MDQ7808645.1 hypothetical protein [Amycolatopsis sp. A133]